MSKNVRRPRPYTKLADHYLGKKKLTQEAYSKLVDSIDDILISYNGKDQLLLLGELGNFRISTDKAGKISWAIHENVIETMEPEEEKEVTEKDETTGRSKPAKVKARRVSKGKGRKYTRKG